jgi:hypothetical protein
MSTTQYWGGPSNVVFDTQNTLAQLKCKMGDLQTIVNKISPGSVPISESNSNSSSSNITLPISTIDVNCADSDNQTTNLQTRLNFLYLQILNAQSSSGSTNESDSG